MYIGPCLLDGGEIDPIVTARLPNLSPVVADGGIVNFSVYDGDNILESGSATPFDTGHLTGAYKCAITPTTAKGYARGHRYRVFATYSVTAEGRLDQFIFLVT